MLAIPGSNFIINQGHNFTKIMLISCSRANEGIGNTCLIAVARGCVVETYAVCDNGNKLERVADWCLDSMVVALSVAAVDAHGFLVTAASAAGIGWSWIESEKWTIVGTFFQDIIGDVFSTPLTTSLKTGAEKSQESESSAFLRHALLHRSEQSSLLYMPGVRLSILSLGYRLFLTCTIRYFGQPMCLVTTLCYATELGSGGNTKGALPYMQMQLEQETRALSTVAMPTHVSSINVTAVSGLGAALNRGENDHAIVVIRQDVVSDHDSSLVMQCHHTRIFCDTLRWCELEVEGDASDARHLDPLGRSKGVTQSKMGALRGEGGILRVLWEMVLPVGARWCTEPYNNDGRDSRKLLYLVLSTLLVRVYNVNGLVCEYTPSYSDYREPSSAIRYGCPEGLTVARLPLSNECRRLLLVSTSAGFYLSIQLDDLRCNDYNCVDGVNPDLRDSGVKHESRHFYWSLLSMRPLADQRLSECFYFSSRVACASPVIPCAEWMYLVSPPQEEDAIILESVNVAILGYHSRFGLQLLSTETRYVDDRDTLENRSSAEEKGANDDKNKSVQYFSATSCLASSSLCRLTGVKKCVTTSHSFHNNRIPQSIVAACSLDSDPAHAHSLRMPFLSHLDNSDIETKLSQADNRTTEPFAAVESVLYSCEFGVPIEIIAEAEVDIAPDLLGGIQLFGLNRAAVWATEPLHKWNATAGFSDKRGGVAHTTWPLLLTSRALKQTGLLMLDLSQNKICPDAPSFMRICSDKPTVAFLLLGDGTASSGGLAVQVTAEHLGLIYLEEQPAILKLFGTDIALKVSTEALGLAEALEPLPLLELSESESSDDDNDDVISDVSDDIDENEAELVPAINLELDHVEATVSDDEETTESELIAIANAAELARQSARLDRQNIKKERLRRRNEEELKLIEREKEWLGRQRRKNEAFQARKAARDNRKQNSIPWRIEYAGALGESIAIAGGGQLVVLQLTKSDEDKTGGNLDANQQSSVPSGKPNNRRQASTSQPGKMQRDPFRICYKHMMPAPIVALGTLMWQGQKIVAVGCLGSREVHVLCPPNGPDKGLGSVALEQVLAIRLPVTKNNFAVGVKCEPRVQNLVFVPLGSSDDLTADELVLESWYVPTSTPDGAAATPVQNKVSRLRSAVESASKITRPDVTPLLSVLALVVTMADGSLLVYYLYLRQNKDLSVKSWQAALYQQYHCSKRIISVTAVDTRLKNLSSALEASAANAPPSARLSPEDLVNEAALLVRTIEGGHYLLHFALGARLENSGIGPADAASSVSAKTDAPGVEVNSATDDIMKLDIGSLHVSEEMAANSSFDSMLKRDSTSLQSQLTDPMDISKTSMHAKRLERLAALRASLMTPEELQAAETYHLRHKSQGFARQCWLPRKFRDHVWTWVPLLPGGERHVTGSFVQIPGACDQVSYGASNHLLERLGLAWLSPSPVLQDLSDNHASPAQEMSTVLRLGSLLDNTPRFHPQHRTHVPGAIVDMQQVDNGSKVVVGWKRAYSANDCAGSLVCGVQGVAVLDVPTLACLWRTSYPCWPPSLPEDFISAQPNNHSTAAGLPPSAPVSAASTVALSNTISMRAAAAKQAEQVVLEKKALDLAIETALRALSETVSFANSSHGHRTLQAVLPGLPPMLVNTDYFADVQVAPFQEYITLLHSVSIALNVPTPLPKCLPCVLVSVLALSQAQIPFESLSESKLSLQALGTYAHIGNGNIVSMVLDFAELEQNDFSMALSARTAKKGAMQRPIHATTERYLLLACDDDISVIGWRPDNISQASVNEHTSFGSRDVNSGTRLKLQRLCHVSHSCGSVLDMRAGVRVGDTCKVFVTSHTASTDVGTSHSPSDFLLQILSFSNVNRQELTLNPERVVHLPHGVPSLLSLSDVFYPNGYMTRHQGCDATIPLRAWNLSYVDRTNGDVVSLQWDLQEVVRPKANFKKDIHRDFHGSHNRSKGTHYAAVIEQESRNVALHQVSSEDAQMTFRRTCLSEGLQPSQVLLNCAVGVVARSGHQEAVSGYMAPVRIILGSDLTFHAKVD